MSLCCAFLSRPHLLLLRIDGRSDEMQCQPHWRAQARTHTHTQAMESVCTSRSFGVSCEYVGLCKAARPSIHSQSNNLVEVHFRNGDSANGGCGEESGSPRRQNGNKKECERKQRRAAADLWSTFSIYSSWGIFAPEYGKNSISLEEAQMRRRRPGAAIKAPHFQLPSSVPVVLRGAQHTWHVCGIRRTNSTMQIA